MLLSSSSPSLFRAIAISVSWSSVPVLLMLGKGIAELSFPETFNISPSCFSVTVVATPWSDVVILLVAVDVDTERSSSHRVSRYQSDLENARAMGLATGRGCGSTRLTPHG
ncbi:hypothetical protein F5883DRAFT_593806 [Diaporthe sp. PMI_573]|nr:hypothetical protein F5883DRAFT_593806 [Diaporthaceae sp. PMI_573]